MHVPKHIFTCLHTLVQCRVSLCILSAGKCAHSCTAYSYSNHLYSVVITCTHSYTLTQCCLNTVFLTQQSQPKNPYCCRTAARSKYPEDTALRNTLFTAHTSSYREQQYTQTYTHVYINADGHMNSHWALRGGVTVLMVTQRSGIHASASSFQSLSQLLFCHSSSWIKIGIKQVEGRCTVFGLTCVVENLQFGICSEV